MNLYAYFLLVILGHFHIVEVIVLFFGVFFIAQGFSCSISSTKRFWWSRFSFCTCRHPELWSLRASAIVPPSCKSHQYQMSYFVGNDFDMLVKLLSQQGIWERIIKNFLNCTTQFWKLEFKLYREYVGSLPPLPSRIFADFKSQYFL